MSPLKSYFRPREGLVRCSGIDALNDASRWSGFEFAQTGRGTLEAGKVADFVAWQIDRPADLAYWLGGELDKRVVRHGVDVTV